MWLLLAVLTELAALRRLVNSCLLTPRLVFFIMGVLGADSPRGRWLSDTVKWLFPEAYTLAVDLLGIEMGVAVVDIDESSWLEATVYTVSCHVISIYQRPLTRVNLLHICFGKVATLFCILVGAIPPVAVLILERLNYNHFILVKAQIIGAILGEFVQSLYSECCQQTVSQQEMFGMALFA